MQPKQPSQLLLPSAASAVFLLLLLPHYGSGVVAAPIAVAATRLVAVQSTAVGLGVIVKTRARKILPLPRLDQNVVKQNVQGSDT